MRISTVWKDAFLIKAGEWTTVRLYISDIIAGVISEPFSGTTLTVANVTDVAFYVRELEKGESVYISSIKAVKEAE